MDFESPDVMKNFPGLYGSDLQAAKGTDTDYGDDADKAGKKDGLIGKRKDKKDKDRGYAALEGESSTEESCETRSPSKSKKSKSFKFPTKSKERREKSRDKEKETTEKKKDKKPEKKAEKDKSKADKKEKRAKCDENADIGEILPIFGVPLQTAVERGCCHDGIDLPLPLRNCIDYIEKYGLTFEGVYKINAPKSKVASIKKLYNQREPVDLAYYDVPTVTALFKVFIRGLGEPVFTTDLLVRFEEAGAILNVAMREKHLKILVNNLPEHNRLALSWIIVHLYNVTLNEKYNKMNAQSITMCLSSTLQTSHRLLTALLCHCPALFPDVTLIPYEPPASGSQLPEDPALMECELLKQESLLLQIHNEMSTGIVIKKREELLWEVQRIITQLKRKLKSANKDKEAFSSAVTLEEKKKETSDSETTVEVKVDASIEHLPVTNQNSEVQSTPVTPPTVASSETSLITDASGSVNICDSAISKEDCYNLVDKSEEAEEADDLDKKIAAAQLRNTFLEELRNSFTTQIENEKKEIESLKSEVKIKYSPNMIFSHDACSKLDEIMDLLQKENQILEIKKIGLVRQIMEQLECCIDLKTRIETET